MLVKYADAPSAMTPFFLSAIFSIKEKVIKYIFFVITIFLISCL